MTAGWLVYVYSHCFSGRIMLGYLCKDKMILYIKSKAGKLMMHEILLIFILIVLKSKFKESINSIYLNFKYEH